jgi:hypothetical protein
MISPKASTGGLTPANRKKLLRQIVVGDIFHAEAPNGASLICLTTKVSKTIIEARTVTTQKHYRFSRTTGLGQSEARVKCAIDSVAPLPIDIHNVMLGIDRKFRLVFDVADLKLNNAEKKALLFIDSYYAENAL